MKEASKTEILEYLDRVPMVEGADVILFEEPSRSNGIAGWQCECGMINGPIDSLCVGCMRYISVCHPRPINLTKV